MLMRKWQNSKECVPATENSVPVLEKYAEGKQSLLKIDDKSTNFHRFTRTCIVAIGIDLDHPR